MGDDQEGKEQRTASGGGVRRSFKQRRRGAPWEVGWRRGGAHNDGVDRVRPKEREDGKGAGGMDGAEKKKGPRA